MITLLSGENSFGVERALKELVTAFDGAPEKFDGADVELRQLPDLLMGTSLFAEKRLVIIGGLSGNKQAWEALPELVRRMSDDIHLVLVEPSPDKRTKAYKALQKVAEVKTFSLLTERDSGKAEQWLAGEAKRRGIKLDKAAVQAFLKRSLVPAERGQPTIDQWQAVHSLDKLSVFGEITLGMVEKYIDLQPIDSVFELFETALKGDRPKLGRLLASLEPTEDPFKVFGLLSSQAFQLATLAVSGKPSTETAKDIGTHPFVVGKLAPFARRFGRSGAKQVVNAMKEADEAMKTSKAAPWVLIERALVKIAMINL